MKVIHVSTVAVLFLSASLVPACDATPDAPATEQGENDENDPAAPENDPAAPETPPANWSKLNTTVAPTLLSVYANGSEKNAGTGASLQLWYANEAGTFSCTVSGVASGKTASCTPTMTDTWTSDNLDRFRLSFATSSNTDGLRFSTVSAKINGVTYSRETFIISDDPVDSNMECSGCKWCTDCLWWSDCGSCYLDGNNHSDCINVQMMMDKDHPIECLDFG